MATGREAGAMWVCAPGVDGNGLWHLRCEDHNPVALAGLSALDREPGIRYWFVPTYSLPIDPEFARQLVRATLCAGAPCPVIYDAEGVLPSSLAGSE